MLSQNVPRFTATKLTHHQKTELEAASRPHQGPLSESQKKSDEQEPSQGSQMRREHTSEHINAIKDNPRNKSTFSQQLGS